LRTVDDHGDNDIGTFCSVGSRGCASAAVGYETIDGRSRNVTANHVNAGAIHGSGHPHPH